MKIVPIGPSDAPRFDRAVRTGPSFVLFYSPTCTYCAQMIPAWNRLCQQDRHEGNLMKVHASALSQIKSPCARTVNGFPTMAKVGTGGEIDTMYEGPRDYDSLARFIDAHFKPACRRSELHPKYRKPILVYEKQGKKRKNKKVRFVDPTPIRIKSSKRSRKQSRKPTRKQSSKPTRKQSSKPSRKQSRSQNSK